MTFPEQTRWKYSDKSWEAVAYSVQFYSGPHHGMFGSADDDDDDDDDDMDGQFLILL
ncbi:hypothetical protein IHE45_19G128800 [Dioscorea alata]|uniref:Uncharacterized protein n=1 Tax=Dioscorea alata TaxID=55571 RepID=A0ACB7U1W6_DIOAL|nr:hypothetical protein IHE45_19G128800 [Dioscorea alata]